MADTPAEGQATSNTAKVVQFGDYFLAVDEIAFARNASTVVGTNISEASNVDGCQVEFKRKGTIFIPGLTAAGLFSLVQGAPF